MQCSPVVVVTGTDAFFLFFLFVCAGDMVVVMVVVVSNKYGRLGKTPRTLISGPVRHMQGQLQEGGAAWAGGCV